MAEPVSSKGVSITLKAVSVSSRTVSVLPMGVWVCSRAVSVPFNWNSIASTKFSVQSGRPGEKHYLGFFVQAVLAQPFKPDQRIEEGTGN